MEQDKKLYSLLGLCKRAGGLQSGEFQTKKAVQEQRACLVIVSTEASEGTKKLFRDKCSYYNIPLYIYGARQELGRCIGKEDRCSIAVLDEGFAKGVIERLKGLGAERESAVVTGE